MIHVSVTIPDKKKKKKKSENKENKMHPDARNLYALYLRLSFKSYKN